MPIPTMAVACRPENSSSGPAVSALLSGVIDSVETHAGDIALPTHLGMGIRFGLGSGERSCAGKKVDVSCRVDLISIALGSAGAEPVHPTPAVHLDAHLWEMDWSGTQTHLLGSAESSTRLRSVDMHIGWRNEDVLDSFGNSTGQKESIWDASISLNDAAFMGHMEWPDIPTSGTWDSNAILSHSTDIPGRLVIDGLSSAAGALEVLGAFMQDYAQRQAEERFESFLEGLEELGFANRTGSGPELPQWQLDQNAIQTFLADPLAYLQSFILDPYGQIDLSRPLPFGGRSVLDMLASILPMGRILDDPLDLLDGSVLFEIPLPFSSGSTHLHLTPDGTFGLSTDPISLGPMDLYASIGMPLLSPDDWISTGPTMSFTLQAAEHVSGILGDCALVLARNSPWSLTLDLPSSGYVPSYDGSSFNWVQPPNQIDLLSGTGIDDFLSYVPGMVLDSALCTIIERVLSPRVSGSSAIGTVLSELDLITWDSSGALSANSVFPLLYDPLGHINSCFTNSQGLDSSAIMNVAGSLLGLLPSGLEKYNSLDELIQHDVIGPISRIVLPISILELSLQESPTIPGTMSLMLSTSAELQASLTSANIDLDAVICLNLHPDFSMDLDGTHVDVGFAIGAMISGLSSPPSGFLGMLLNSLANAEANISARLDSGIFHLEVDVDFNPLDSTPAAHLTLLPTVSGIESFLKQLVSSLADAVLSDLIEYVILKLNSITVYNSVSLAQILEDLLDALGIWDSNSSPKIAFGPGSMFEQLCLDPVAYLRTRLLALLNAAMVHLSELFPSSGSDPFLKVTPVPSSGTANYHRIEVIHSSAPSFISDLSLNIGSKVASGPSGIWLGYSTSITTGLSGANVVISTDVGALRDSATMEWEMSATISAHTDAILNDDLFKIQPAIQFDLTGDVISLLISTVTDSPGASATPSTGSDAFWIQALPTDQFAYDTPDLSVLLLGAANSALTFIEQNSKVQDFLKEPLIQLDGNNDWRDALSELTIIGDWLVHLGVCTYNSATTWDPPTSKPTPASPPALFYDIRGLQDIIEHYDPSTSHWNQASNGYEILLRGSMSMICSVIDGSIAIYTKKNAENEMELEISLDVENNPGSTIFGISVDFAPIEIPLGNLMLTLDFKDSTEDLEYDDNWAHKHKEYTTGITLQLLKWSPSGSPMFDDHFSLEFGHLSLHLGKSDMQPMLDSFISLDAVAITTCFDLTFSGAFASEVGGRLDLEGFGISLGGNGSSDGGNTLAAGVLDGGEGNESVKPTFDISVWKYHVHDVDFDIKGSLEHWFPVNKQFGPIKIAQIGVRYEDEDADGDTHRLSILVDGEAEIAGFLAQVDDLSVSIPLLEMFEFEKWKYDMAGCAISYSGPAFSLAGALRKTLVTPAGGGPEYIEYQGLVSISTKTMSINAIGAFGRVPVVGDENSYVTCFVIAAIDTPIGGPPMFFVTGLLGGVGLNRELVTPDVTMVSSSPFMLAMDSSALAANPMGALESIRTHLPAERGSFWFAVGVKFTTFQVIESKAVLYLKISDDDFALGLIGLSAMSLPTPDLNIGYIELAFAASYDSGTNIFRAEAQLTDASYLFSKSCRLTGGFALVNWFNRGDFLLSIGGYHPKFKVPSHYPIVPRLGFNWKPMSKVVIKGEAYFTVCSSAVMLGGGFEATYKSGCLSASFRAGVDVLIVFDPFFYSFRVYIGVSVRLKTWFGTLKAGLGADLEIEGPKMRGKARIEVVFIEFTVKFGSQTSGSAQPISGKEFINKHILQRPEDEFNASFKDIFEKQFSLIQPTNGVIRSTTKSEIDDDESLNGPFNLETEFEFAFSHLFPSESHSVYLGSAPPEEPDGDEKIIAIGNNWRDDVTLPDSSQDSFDIAPCHIDADTNGAPFVIEILKKGSIIPFEDTEYCSDDSGNPIGLSYIPTLGHFAATLWSCEMDSNNSPKAKTSAPESQPRYFNGGSLLGRSTQNPIHHRNVINLSQTEKTVFIHNLPLRTYVDTDDITHLKDYLSKVIGATKVVTTEEVIRDSKAGSSKPSIMRESGIKSFSMDMLSNVLELGNSKHVSNRKALDAYSGITNRKKANSSGRKNLGVRAVKS